MIDTRDYITDGQALTTIAILLQQFSDGQDLIEVLKDVMVSNGSAYFDDADRFRANRG